VLDICEMAAREDLGAGVRHPWLQSPHDPPHLVAAAAFQMDDYIANLPTMDQLRESRAM